MVRLLPVWREIHQRPGEKAGAPLSGEAAAARLSQALRRECPGDQPGIGLG